MVIAERIIKHQGTAINFDGIELSYNELRRIALQTAYYLQQKGHQKVAFKVGNHQAYVPVFLGCVLFGAHPFLLHPYHPGNDQLIGEIEPDIIIDDFDEFLSRIATQRMDINVHPKSADQLLFVGFTSGTTGLPKGYRRTEQSWLDSFKLNNEVFQLQAFQYYIAGGPLYHSLTLFAAISALYEGKTIYLMSEFDGNKIPDFNHAVIFGVPSMLELMFRHPTDRQLVFLSSGSKLEEHTLKKAEQLFPNMTIYEYFGSSEASYISYLSPEDRLKHPHSVGKFFPHVQYNVESDGSLWLKSPYMFTGYFNQPDVQNMINTGDIAEIKDGFLYLLGRQNNRLIVGGRNVFPEEVERVIMKELPVRDVMVTSKPHYLLGEVPIAIVNPDVDFDIVQAKKIINDKLEKYKRPLRWVLDNEFLYTDSGKIARAQMKERHGLD